MHILSKRRFERMSKQASSTSHIPFQIIIMINKQCARSSTLTRVLKFSDKLCRKSIK
jgi:hypothetical protein